MEKYGDETIVESASLITGNVSKHNVRNQFSRAKVLNLRKDRFNHFLALTNLF